MTVHDVVVVVTGATHEAGTGTGFDFTRDAQLGTQFVDPLSLTIQRGAEVYRACAGYGIQITDSEIGGQAFDAMVKQTVRHRRIEQGRDQSSVHDAGVALPVLTQTHSGRDASLARVEAQIQRSRITTGEAVGVTGGSVDGV